MRGGSCPHRAIVTNDGFANGTGSFFGLLINAYSRDWTPGQQERFLELIDREFPDVTRATVVYLERCVEAGPLPPIDFEAPRSNVNVSPVGSISAGVG